MCEVSDARNDAVQADLGIAVPNDTSGVLQDLHWCTGQFGTFCNYTVGNVMATQLFDTSIGQDDVGAGLEAADYRPLKEWLTHHVLQHGLRHTRDVLLERATGRTLDPARYLVHLNARFGEVYDLV
ncbi:MAG: hypothetical protein WBA25_13300 [Jannaschia sp.]